jgi:CDP-glucose 4,6-dehydratase
VSFPSCFDDVYRGRAVLVTGHTGFKGSWLCLWLARLGARVAGFSLPPPTHPNHWELLDLSGVTSVIGDVRNPAALTAAFAEHQPEVVFHLAAQPLVRRSYREPVETYTTNVTGTVNVFEACRATPSVRSIVCVTSDKVYENRESSVGYTESDPLGGYDPYSNSKACAELVARCYRQAYFGPTSGGPLLATARAGNVIGGGDWAEDRLIPDAIRAASTGEPVRIRNPRAVRPWQHVLDPLAGYLLLGAKLLAGDRSAADAWNFGPEDDGNVEVQGVIGAARAAWPAVRMEVTGDPTAPHETKVLKLDAAKARSVLGWLPVWPWRDAVRHTIEWYRAHYEAGTVTSDQGLARYLADARAAGGRWARA